MKEWIDRFRTDMQTKRGDSRKKSPALFWIGIVGMLLILMSDFISPGMGKTKKAPGDDMNLELYASQLENKLQQVLSQVEGAGKTTVMITLDSSCENVYAVDEKTGGTAGNETKHILLNTSGEENALIEMTWQPEIRGVAVVCEGGGNVAVTSRITEMVSVLLGVSTNRISVAKMN